MKRECEIYTKDKYDKADKINEGSNNKNDFHYYKKSFVENGTLDDLFDFE